MFPKAHQVESWSWRHIWCHWYYWLDTRRPWFPAWPWTADIYPLGTFRDFYMTVPTSWVSWATPPPSIFLMYEAEIHYITGYFCCKICSLTAYELPDLTFEYLLCVLQSVCVCVCVYVCMYVCMYVFFYINFIYTACSITLGNTTRYLLLMSLCSCLRLKLFHCLIYYIWCQSIFSTNLSVNALNCL
jgi:hypothetical protein